MFCTKCGATLPEGTTFCTNCGNKMEATTPGATTTPGYTMPNFATGTTNTKDSKLLTAILSAVSALLALIGMFSWLSMKASAMGMSDNQTIGLFKLFDMEGPEEAMFSYILLLLSALVFVVALVFHVLAAVKPFIGMDNTKTAPRAAIIMVAAFVLQLLSGMLMAGAFKGAMGYGDMMKISIGPSIWVWLAAIVSAGEIFLTKSSVGKNLLK